MSFNSLEEKYANSTPLLNPITYNFNKKYKTGCLGEGGKIYLKRGKMFDPVLERNTEPYYMIPNGWGRPEGFYCDICCWKTDSEMMAVRHYRKYGQVQPGIKKKFDDIIARQDYFYELSNSTDCDIELPDGIKEGFVPRPHQKVGMFHAEQSGLDHLLVLDGMRSGKTFQALLVSASKKAKTVLIVCPAMLKNVWENAINTIFEYSDINLLNSNDEIKQNSYNICSFDIIHTINADVDFCIIDECHYMIEKDARRSYGVSRIKAAFKMAMSGTAILNSPYEILPVLEWLNKDLHDEVKLFLDSSQDDEFTKAKELANILRRKCAIQRTTEQLSTVSTSFLNFIELNTNLPDNATLQELAHEKIPYAIEYINNYKDEKIIATVQHLGVARKLASSLGNQAVVITGETPDGIRKQIQDAFAKGVRVLIGSSAISEGLDFSFSSRILMVELSYSFRSEQLRRRTEKVGKTQPTNTDILVSKHKKDQRVLEILNGKYNMNQGFTC